LTKNNAIFRNVFIFLSRSSLFLPNQKSGEASQLTQQHVLKQKTTGNHLGESQSRNKSFNKQSWDTGTTNTSERDSTWQAPILTPEPGNLPNEITTKFNRYDQQCSDRRSLALFRNQT
jgi:hypothetical protein